MYACALAAEVKMRLDEATVFNADVSGGGLTDSVYL
jgi:hypothetical protein